MARTLEVYTAEGDKVEAKEDQKHNLQYSWLESAKLGIDTVQLVIGEF